MKKIIALLLCLIMTVSVFAGCAPQEQNPTDPSNAATQPTDPTNGNNPTDPTNGNNPTEGNDPTEGTQPTEGNDATVPSQGTEPGATEPQLKTMTIADLLALDVAHDQITGVDYLVTATVESITNPMYGAMIISDATGTISVYNTKNDDGTFYENMADKPYKGDTVVIRCNIKNFNGTYEINQAYIISFTHNEVEIDTKDYKEMTIAKARDAKTGTKVMVSGVVAQITYANGRKPSGVILVDKTGSIYVYDNQLAARVSVGNTVTICASKTYWILADEQNNANKFGYKGCNQLESVTLIDIDESKSDFNTSWIKTTTVKDLLDTPVTEDITTQIFKVTALVKKAPGNGFVNYYINDLDGTTGTYVYTQCNGGDFEWMDAYDGKICTVYVTILNAKSSNAGCVYRFLPIKIVDEGFDPSSVNGAEHGVKYYGVGQFLSSYTGNPALELLTSVDAELLGFKGIKLSYTSSDPSVISIDGNVMNCLKTGTATITVTGSYNGKTYSQDVTISVTITEQEKTYPTVADAIAAAPDTTVIVKGVVAASLVNQTGFYLIDKTGTIAVLTTKEVMETLKLGDEVVLECTRIHRQKEGSAYFGQSHLQLVNVVANNYGKHSYSTDSFITDKTIAELSALPTNTDHSTNVYIVTGSIKFVETQNFSTAYITDGTTDWLLYTSSGKQYNFLKEYVGQEVTIEVAACDWNCKGYKACVLAITLADGTKIVNNVNFNG